MNASQQTKVAEIKKILLNDNKKKPRRAFLKILSNSVL